MIDDNLGATLRGNESKKRRRFGLLYRGKARIAGILALSVVITLLSPVLMAWAARQNLPWNELSDVGETYGGASALLSAAALCGIGASLIFQQRQLQHEIINIDRQRHFDLMKSGLDNPELLKVVDPEFGSAGEMREIIFANLTMGYWLAVWELGDMTEGELKSNLTTMFQSDISWRWWERAGNSWGVVF